jgi:hypothetical protein
MQNLATLNIIAGAPFSAGKIPDFVINVRSRSVSHSKGVLLKSLALIVPFFFSLSALAGPSHSYLLTCKSAQETAIDLTVLSQSPTGITTPEIWYRKDGGPATMASNVITDVAIGEERAPKTYMFFADSTSVILRLSKDAITAAMEGDQKATLTLDQVSAPAVCTGTQEF